MTNEQPKYTVDQIRSAIIAQWKKDFGKMRDDTAERDGYFVLGFVLAAIENNDMQEKIPPVNVLHRTEILERYYLRSACIFTNRGN